MTPIASTMNSATPSIARLATVFVRACVCGSIGVQGAQNEGRCGIRNVRCSRYPFPEFQLCGLSRDDQPSDGRRAPQPLRSVRTWRD
jgi:hypothetical protein